MSTNTPRQGVTWFQPSRELMVAIVAVMAVFITLLAGVSPAYAAKGPKGGGEPPASDLQACSSLTGSFTLADVNDAIGATAVHNLPKAKGKSTAITGVGIDIAVIDTGITVPDGADSTSPTTIENVADGVDLSFDALNSELIHEDLYGHGTNMAGIIAGSDDLAYGSGVAPDARIIDVKVGAGDGAVDASQVIAAINWAVEHRNANGMNIRIIELAYDTDADVDYRYDPLSFAVENAWHNGIVVIVAGGNDGRGIGRLGNPALNPYVIAVGASELGSNGWKIPAWSSTGDGTRNPDLVAPGASILSLGTPGSYLNETAADATCIGTDGATYLRGSGTSQASAVVAGSAALLLQQRPNLTPDQVKHLLTSTAVDLGHQDRVEGAGMLDLAAALDAPTPFGFSVAQTFAPAMGIGPLHDARGTFLVGTEGDYLTGETTAFGGDWNSTLHALQTLAGVTWSGVTWSGVTWSGGTWSGATWSGATWSGATWSGATWSGATWSGATWSGATWSGATWSGATWSGATWSGATWSGATWS